MDGSDDVDGMVRGFDARPSRSSGRHGSGVVAPAGSGGRHRSDGRPSGTGQVDPGRPARRTSRPRTMAAATIALVCAGVLGFLPSAGVGGPVSPTGEVLGAPDPSGPVDAIPAIATGAAPVAGSPSAVDAAAFTEALPDQRAEVAVRTALAQRGLPYVWGGNGPTAGDAGFDCSGLTTYSYGVAGVDLPRTAHTQYYAGPHVPSGAALQPGDLVFYGTSARVHHVGMYVGAGRMVNAPTFGEPVQVAYYRWAGDDYLGATRPAADGDTFPGEAPTVPVDPAPPLPGSDDVFRAPPATLPPVLPRATDPQPPEQQTASEARRATGAPPLPAVLAPTTPATPTTTPATTTPAAPTTTPAATTPATPSVTPPLPTTSSPPPSPTPPTTTTPAGLPTTVTEVTFPGGPVPLLTVRPGPDGLPSTPGAAASSQRVVIRLADDRSTTAVVVGSRIVLRGPDGPFRYAVVSTTPGMTTARAADLARSAAGPVVVVLVPDGDGTWTVLVAR